MNIFAHVSSEDIPAYMKSDSPKYARESKMKKKQNNVRDHPDKRKEAEEHE